MNIAEFTELSIFKALEFIDGLELNEKGRDDRPSASSRR